MRRSTLLPLLLLVACTEPPLVEPAPTATPEPMDDDDSSEEPCVERALDGEAAFVELQSSVEHAWVPCEATRHASAGAAGMTVSVQTTASVDVVMTLRNVLEEPLAEAVLGIGGSLEVTLEQSGEFLIDLSPVDPEHAGDYRVSVSCEDDCDQEFTRYPIVLMHGMAGTDEYFNSWTYYFQVLELLHDVGYAAVTPAVDGLASTPDRSDQWAAHLDQLFADGLGRKVHLIAHSQGGLDARYVVSTLGYADRVATVTTIATPHHGSQLGNVAANIADAAPAVATLIEEGLSLLTEAIGLGEAELIGALASVTTDDLIAFNAATPDHPDVRYFSWSARTCSLLEPGCRDETDGEIVAPYLLPTYRALQLMGGANDGIVPTESGIWGEHLGQLGADHFDEVGQIAGLTDGSYDHRAFFLAEARRLKDLGL